MTTILSLPPQKKVNREGIMSKRITTFLLFGVALLGSHSVIAQPINFPPSPSTSPPSTVPQTSSEQITVPSAKSTSSTLFVPIPTGTRLGPIVDSLPARLPPARAAYTWYPLALVAGHFMVGVEKPISKTNSLKGALSFGSAKEPQYYVIDNYMAFYGEGQFRHYLSKEALRGFYFGGFLAGRQSNYTYVETSNPGSNLEIGASQFAARFGLVVGTQVAIRQLVPLDLYIGCGPQFIFGDTKDLEPATPVDSYKNGVILQAGLALGLYQR